MTNWLIGAAAIGISFLLALGLFVWWAWWYYGRTVKFNPSMTPDEMRAARQYAAQYVPRPAAVRITDDDYDDDQTEAERLAADERRQQKRAEAERQRAERQQQEAEAKAARQAEADRQAALLADLVREFPWLPELAARYAIPPTYENLDRLKGWIKRLLAFADAQRGEVSIRTLTWFAKGQSDVPYTGVNTMHFIRALLQYLEQNNLIVPNPPNPKARRLAAGTMAHF